MLCFAITGLAKIKCCVVTWATKSHELKARMFLWFT
jgi:hypothetical protein